MKIALGLSVLVFGNVVLNANSLQEKLDQKQQEIMHIRLAVLSENESNLDSGENYNKECNGGTNGCHKCRNCDRD